LIASVAQRVQGKWVIFGRGHLFFDEAAEDADFVFGKLQSHEEIIAADTGCMKLQQMAWESGPRQVLRRLNPDPRFL
jgi:hypothetical protein